MSSLTLSRTDRFPRLLVDVVSGLTGRPRTLPSKYFYDELGSKLFDEICELEEYYPTRTEASIMSGAAGEMAEQLGRDVRLVEYGSGSSTKTRLLLDHLVDPVSYIPVDVSGNHLNKTARRLRREYPLLEIAPVAADFTKPLTLPTASAPVARTCIYFPGSTIGNFTPADASELLDNMLNVAGPNGGLLIGFDLQKDKRVLERAYNDRQGVTEAFNKNILRRINRELDADFELDNFWHIAFYNSRDHRIEMHLVSNRDQQVSVADQLFDFRAGETIRTELSHKYTIPGFAKLAAGAGWTCEDVWTDERQYFAVMYLTAN